VSARVGEQFTGVFTALVGVEQHPATDPPRTAIATHNAALARSAS